MKERRQSAYNISEKNFIYRQTSNHVALNGKLQSNGQNYYCSGELSLPLSPFSSGLLQQAEGNNPANVQLQQTSRFLRPAAPEMSWCPTGTWSFQTLLQLCSANDITFKQVHFISLNYYMLICRSQINPCGDSVLQHLGDYFLIARIYLLALWLVLDDDLIGELLLLFLLFTFLRELRRVSIQLHFSLQLVCTCLLRSLHTESKLLSEIFTR